jgi:hypothetical protein
MEVLALIVVVSLVITIHLLGLRAGRRWGARLRDPVTRAGASRRMVGFCAIAALVAVAVMVWANTGDRSMNLLGWARYVLLLILFVGIGAWMFVRTRSR